MNQDPPLLSAESRHRTVIAWLNMIGPVMALVIVYLFFAVRVPKIMQPLAVENIIRQTVIVGTASIGMTLVIIAGGIDLSVGSIIALSSVVMARLLTWTTAGGSMVESSPIFWPFVAVTGGIVVAALCGLINGLLITSLRLAPFIVTLGTLAVVRGIGLGLAGSKPVNPPETWLSALLARPEGSLSWMLLSPGVWIMLVLTVLTMALLRYARIGRHIFAVGSNVHAARLCGVAVERIQLFVYTASGVAGGLGGLMLLSRQSQGDPTAAEGYELDVIAAVVIGGGSLSGGEGSVLGSLVGALIMTVIDMGCMLEGWQNYVQKIVTGAIIVIAVALDRLRHGRKA